MNVLSCFDGISCARVALERAGFKVDSYFASEIDKYAIQIAQKNYPDTIQVGDIKNISGLRPHIEFDLLIGGSPCQDLSIAKKNREGLSGSRSGLFWEYVRILKELKPRYFILENVNSMPKESKQLITETLGVDSIMINAALVSAQNRRRLFWVGKLVGDKYEKVEVSQPKDRGIFLKDILEDNVDEKYNISAQMLDTFSKPSGKDGAFQPMKPREEDGKAVTLTARYYKMGRGDNYVRRIGQIGNGGQGDRIYSTDGKSVSLSANGGGRGAKTGLYLTSEEIERLKYLKGAKKEKRIKDGYEYTYSEGALKLVQEEKSLPLMASGGNSISRTTNFVEVIGVASRTYPRIPNGEKREKRIEVRDDEKANAMTSVQTDSMVMENTQIRKLTPIECERLQGLPDNYTEGISNTQRYKALGNAFNVDVIVHILKNIKEKEND